MELVSKSIKLASVIEIVIESYFINFLPTKLKEIHTISSLSYFQVQIFPVPYRPSKIRLLQSFEVLFHHIIDAFFMTQSLWRNLYDAIFMTQPVHWNAYLQIAFPFPSFIHLAPGPQGLGSQGSGFSIHLWLWHTYPYWQSGSITHSGLHPVMVSGLGIKPGWHLKSLIGITYSWEHINESKVLYN